MGPKWILARARQGVAESDWVELEWRLVIMIALRPTESGRPINQLAAHVAVNALRDVEPESRVTRDRAISLIDQAMSLLSEEMR
jgi:hypothetical protein